MNTDWVVPHDDPVLGKEEAHFWLVDLKLNSKKTKIFETFLSPEEMARAKKFYTKELYQKYVIARGALRQILSLYLCTSPHAVLFNYTPNGKPFIKGSLSFNISHSKDLAIIALTLNRAIGIDIEYQREITELFDICNRFLTANECHEIFTQPSDQQLNRFYNIWVKKEAYIKAVGGRLFETLASLKDRNQSIDSQSEFAISSISINDEYVSAFAVAQKLMTLKYWQFV